MLPPAPTTDLPVRQTVSVLRLTSQTEEGLLFLRHTGQVAPGGDVSVLLRSLLQHLQWGAQSTGPKQRGVFMDPVRSAHCHPPPATEDLRGGEPGSSWRTRLGTCSANLVSKYRTPEESVKVV